MPASDQPADLSLEELLQRAAVEKDGATLRELVAEINKRYEEEDRLKLQSNNFTIFRGLPDRHAEWVATLVGLAAANERMSEIAAENPGSYFVFHGATGTVSARFNNEPGEFDQAENSA